MHSNERELILFLAGVTLIIFVLICFVGALIYLYKKKQLKYKLNIQLIRSEFESVLLSTQLEIQEQTLKHVSREIHDNIGLTLSMAKLNLNTIEKTESKGIENIEEATELISKAIVDLSNLSKSLNTDFISDNGLLNAINLEIKRLRKVGIYKIKSTIQGDPVFMNTQKELIIFRIIQEALNNSIKYSKASELILNLYYGISNLSITISDNGIGFCPDRIKAEGRGTGLINIRQRAKMISGTSEILTKPGEGTKIKIMIPY